MDDGRGGGQEKAYPHGFEHRGEARQVLDAGVEGGDRGGEEGERGAEGGDAVGVGGHGGGWLGGAGWVPLGASMGGGFAVTVVVVWRMLMAFGVAKSTTLRRVRQRSW